MLVVVVIQHLRQFRLRRPPVSCPDILAVLDPQFRQPKQLSLLPDKNNLWFQRSSEQTSRSSCTAMDSG
jgi:hypothetical protein